ncbi:MAG TPA: C-terminal binding protein [Patescibacteria group bacterium]|nr:C-terminal binding protein [Patescibacteria group bacterium]
MKPKILITEALPLIEREKEILSKYAVVKLAKSPAEDDLIAEVGDVAVLMVVYATITRKIIESASDLKGIVRYGIGVDNVDVKSAAEMGIPVANVPDYCITTVADHAFALLLALNRKIVMADHVVKTGNWGMWTSPSSRLKGFDLEGKMLGLIGIGKIGSAVATRAKAFGMNIIAYDPYLNPEMAKTLGIELKDLDVVLKNSDFISIHSPLTDETRGMIGEQELRSMKKTAYLINTARGPIINELALYRALKNGWIAGAGMDVYEREPPNPENPLFKLENVVLTPHVAYYTEEAISRLEMSAVAEAIRILEGQLPKNLANKKGLT